MSSLGEKFIYFLIGMVIIGFFFDLTGRLFPLIFFKIPALLLFWQAVKEHREYLKSTQKFPLNSAILLTGGFFFALFLGFRWHSLPFLIEGTGVGVGVYLLLAWFDKWNQKSLPSNEKKSNNYRSNLSGENGEEKVIQTAQNRNSSTISPERFSTPIFQKFANQLNQLLQNATRVKKWVVRHQIEEIGEVFFQLLHTLEEKEREPSTQLIVELTSYINLLSQTLNSYLKTEGNISPTEEKELVSLLSQLKERLLEQILEAEKRNLVEFQIDIQLLKEQLQRLEKK